jgi:anti-sigma regulatory factor (Ser/Thr protein kinase)
VPQQTSRTSPAMSATSVPASVAEDRDGLPRSAPALRVPRDPAARDHRWPGQWPRRSHLELAALNTASGCARAHARAVLREWNLMGDAADEAAMVVSELVTNAVVTTQDHHSLDPVRLWMLGDAASVLILVWDATMPAPVLAAAAPGDDYGRGLTIVAALSVRWGFYYPAEQPGGKVVWALIQVAGTPLPPVAAAS